jgi:tagatose 1,6-diphosphate aldolase
LISSELTPYASAILLDPEYGLPAADKRAANAGLLIAYEKTGYDTTEPGRMPDLLADWSALKLKEAGADAVKFMLYYDVDEPEEINRKKQAFVERVGAESAAAGLPFFLELMSYDAKITDTKSKEYAAVKPHKVNAMIKEFAKDRYLVDVLKVEVPVNMAYVAGYSGENEAVYSKEEAAEYFKEQTKATNNVPFIFLSAGVSAELFQETLKFAAAAGSSFNGVLCGRATWRGAIEPFAKEGKEAGKQWLDDQGRKNIEELNDVLKTTANSLFEKLD